MNMQTMKKIFILTAATAMTCSCGIYNRYTPEDTVPDNIYGEYTIEATDTLNFGNIQWYNVFTDTYLQDLIKRGLDNNTDYQTAQLRIQEAEATLMSSKLAFLPSFALSPQGGASGTEGQKATWTYQIPVTANWELDIFGRMRNSKKQAQALLAQSKDYKQAVRTQLISGIANTYYTLLMLDEQLNLSLKTAEAWEETVKSARALMNAGQYDEAAVSQMEATYYSVKTSVLDIRQQICETENSLALLLAETPHHYERGKLSEQIMPENMAIGIPLQLLSNRPDVRSAEHSLEAAFYVTNQARSNFYPSIVLNGNTGWTNDLGAAIINPAQFIASAIGSLTMPLFNRGKNIAQLKIAKAQQEEAKLAFQQTLLNAGTEVNNALMAYQTSKSKTELFELQITSLKKALRSTTLLMENGNRTYLEVLTARQSLLNAELSQVANRFAELQSVVTLYQALGGGREE